MIVLEFKLKSANSKQYTLSFAINEMTNRVKNILRCHLTCSYKVYLESLNCSIQQVFTEHLLCDQHLRACKVSRTKVRPSKDLSFSQEDKPLMGSYYKLNRGTWYSLGLMGEGKVKEIISTEVQFIFQQQQFIFVDKSKIG